MANFKEANDQLLALDGAMCDAIDDSSSSMILGQAGTTLEASDGGGMRALT